MSYILDALRRAQAERGRGGVPGLHTPAVAASSAAEVPQSSGGNRLVWLIAAGAAAIALVLAWLQFSPKASAPAPTPPPAVVASAVVQPEPAPVPVPPPAPAPVPIPTPAPVVIDVTPPPPPPPPAPPVVPQAKPAVVAPAPKPAPAVTGAPQANPAAPDNAKVATAPSTPVYAVGELPAAVREQLPALQLAGITYSSNSKYRMVIVNGQVLHEGESAGPGLVLERIESARTIWAFRGYRFALQ